MILIRLESDDWLDIDDYVFYMLGPRYISDLKDEYTDHVEEGYTAELIDMSLAFISEDFDQCSDVNAVGLTFMGILSFTIDYIV